MPAHRLNKYTKQTKFLVQTRTIINAHFDTKWYFVAVYVVLGEHDALIDILSNMEDRGLVDTGDYAVISVDFDTFKTIDRLRYFRRKYSKKNNANGISNFGIKITASVGHSALNYF